MRRITLRLLSTMAAPVLLFSYRTSTMGGPARVGAASGDSSDFAGTGSADTAAQSADVDTVSGATVTSDGYKQSLQAALDAAHLS